MNEDSETRPPLETAPKSGVKIFGVGNAGLRVLQHLVERGFAGAACAGVSTDPAALDRCPAPEKILLDLKVLRSLGTGADPDRGREAAEENLPKLKAACGDSETILIVTGLGGGAGTGISPVLARVARESGAQVLAVAALPFDCEGNRRRAQAQLGLEQLKAETEGVLCLANQKVFKLIDDQTSVTDTFRITNELLADGVIGLCRLLSRRGLIEIPMADLSAMLRNPHRDIVFATAESAGAARSREIVDRLLAHPLLDEGKVLAEAETVLVSLVGGPDLSMAEIDRVMQPLHARCGRAQVLMGALIDEAFRDRLMITLIAGRQSESASRSGPGESGSGEGAPDSNRLDLHLVRSPSGNRSQSRFVPPAPALPPEKVEELLSGRKSGSGKSRKSATKMRQGQLPLEIVSKGRFDKSEPTIHKGEDLDVPTYIRRGVPLN